MAVLMIAVAVVLVVLTVVFVKRLKFEMAVDRIPGPPKLPIIGNALDILRVLSNEEEVTNEIMKWSAKYNGFFRVWVGPLPFISIARPADIEILLSSGKHLEKAENYALIHDWIGHGLLTNSGDSWRRRRKLITPSFHFNVLEQSVNVFNKNSDILLEMLIKRRGEIINIVDFTHRFSLDVICETAMGTSINAQVSVDSGYVDAVNKLTTSMFYRSTKPWLVPGPIFRVSSIGRAYYPALKIVHKYTRKVLAARKSDILNKSPSSIPAATQDDNDIGRKARSAFLDQLLNSSKNGAHLSDSDIQEEVDTFMFAGHDTTSTAISFALYSLAANPKVQEKVFEEMQDIFGDSERNPTHQDLQNMSYLERVLKETLRLFPSVPVYGRKLREDLQVTDGYVIPAGCNVIVAAYIMGHDPTVWEDPEKFDPDRFLPENMVGRHPFAFVPFSAGPRNCIGQKFAMLEMKAAVSKIVRHCRVSLPSEDYKLVLVLQVLIKALRGVKLKVEPRETREPRGESGAARHASAT